MRKMEKNRKMEKQIKQKSIEGLFTSKARIKILEYFFFNKENSHIREISRELKIPVSAVKREVDNLIALNILSLFESRISLNKKCSYLESLKNIFVETDCILYPIKEALKNEEIQYAFVFGSFANGSFNIESDIDLVVISDKNLFELTKLLKPAENKINREINPVAWDLKSFNKKKNTGFVKDIFSKKIMMVIGGENELRKIAK